MRDSNFEHGASSNVQFEQNEIRFEIPKGTCDGWRMTRLNPLLVCLCSNDALYP